MSQEELHAARIQTEDICLRQVRILSVGFATFAAFIAYLGENYFSFFVCLLIALLSKAIINSNFAGYKEIISNGDILTCKILSKRMKISRRLEIQYEIQLPDGRMVIARVPLRVHNLLGKPDVGAMRKFFYVENPKQNAFPVVN